jgi:hypothetical protein
MSGKLLKIITIQLLILCSLCPAFAAEPVSIDETLSFKNITGNIDYIEDVNKKITFKDITSDRQIRRLKWTKSDKDYINFGYTKSQFWFRFTVDNDAGKVLPWLLEIDFPPIDLIELYLPDRLGRYAVRRTGDNLPFSSRDMKYITYLFKIEQKPGETHFYIRIDSLDSVNFNLNVMSHDYFLERLSVDMPIYWIFFGLMVIMALYHLLLFISTREAGYFYLTGFIITYALFEFNFKGFASQYFWPNATWWTSRANPFLVSIEILWTYLFLIEFIEFKAVFPRLYRPSVLSIMLSCLMLAALSLIVNVQVSLFANYAYIAVNNVVMFSFGVYMAFIRKPHSRQARIAIIAFSVFLISVPIVVLTICLPIFSRGGRFSSAWLRRSCFYPSVWRTR